MECCLNCCIPNSLVSEIPVAHKKTEPDRPQQQQQLAAATDCGGWRHMGAPTWVHGCSCHQGHTSQWNLCPGSCTTTASSCRPRGGFNQKPAIGRKMQPQQPLSFFAIIYILIQSHHHRCPFVVCIDLLNFIYHRAIPNLRVEEIFVRKLTSLTQESSY